MAGPAGYQDQNLVTVAQYLFDHGYSKAAAAGIAGTIAGESGGNPESQGSNGRGLIGWTPASTLPNSAFTGNVPHDLVAQAAQIVVFNEKNDPGSIKTLNSFTDPVKAADFYSRQFERPASPLSDVRPQVATWVFGQLSGAGGAAPGTSPGGGSAISSDILGGIAGDLLNPLLSSLGVSSLTDLFERAGLVIFGLILLIFGVIKLGNGGSKSRSSAGYFDSDTTDSSSGNDDDGEVDDAVLERAYDRAEANGELLDEDETPGRHTVRSHVKGRTQSEGPGRSAGRARTAGPGPKSIKAFGAEGPGLASEAGAAGAGGVAAAAPELAEAAVVAV